MEMEFDLSNIKPSVLNALIILGIVIITVPMAKWFFNEHYVPGVTELVSAI